MRVDPPTLDRLELVKGETAVGDGAVDNRFDPHKDVMNERFEFSLQTRPGR